jgi:hypothetical protein
MKKVAFAVVSAIVLLASCVTKGPKTYPFEEVNIIASEPDTMIYGFCTNVSTEENLVIVTDAEDTIRLSLHNALEKHRVLGGYSYGDEMAVAVNADTTQATYVINMTTLLGNWEMPNPIDGSDQTGIAIFKGGVAESINQSSLVYKSWRIFNGKLLIQTSRNDGIDVDETLIYDIKYLSPDSLVISGEDDIYHFSRPAVELEEEDLGIELDNGEADELIL